MATWLISSDGYYPYCSNCGYEPEPPNIYKDNRTPFCPQCGEVMKKEGEPKIRGNCKICEYMRETKICYDDKTILQPECWGQKKIVSVRYTDSCENFKKKVEK